MTVTRLWQRLVTTRIKIGPELGGDIVADMNDDSSGGTLTVREIPNIHYDDFVDRAICSTNTRITNQVQRAWTCSEASVEFGHLELDPLDELQVIKIDSAIAFNATARVETSTKMSILEELPREVP